LRRPPRPRRRVVPALVPLATAAVAALAAFVFLRTPGSHVQARAARAADATFFVVEDVQARRPGLFPATSVSGYVDGGRGRAHVRIFLRSAGAVAETVLHEDGSVERWLASSDTTTFAPSCDLLPGGCGEVLDPFSFYVRALESGGAHVRRAGGQYLLTLGGGRVEQVAHVDARTYLPRLIEWRQDGRVVAVVRLTSLERQHGGLSPDAWTMSDHGGARVVQLTAAGRPVRVLGARPAARSAAPPPGSSASRSRAGVQSGSPTARTSSSGTTGASCRPRCCRRGACPRRSSRRRAAPWCTRISAVQGPRSPSSHSPTGTPPWSAGRARTTSSCARRSFSGAQDRPDRVRGGGVGRFRDHGRRPLEARERVAKGLR